MFLIKRRFLTYFLCKIRYSVFRNPSTTPYDTPATSHDPQPKIWGVATHQSPRLTSMITTAILVIIITIIIIIIIILIIKQ